MFRNMLAVFGGVGFASGIGVVLTAKAIVVLSFVGFMVYCLIV